LRDFFQEHTPGVKRDLPVLGLLQGAEKAWETYTQILTKLINTCQQLWILSTCHMHMCVVSARHRSSTRLKYFYVVWVTVLCWTIKGVFWTPHKQLL